MNDRSTATGSVLLDGDAREDLVRRWTRLEERFVDDPPGTVEAADDLIREVVDELRAAFDAHRARLRGHWESVDDATTEQLRAALHEYEQLLDRLVRTPAP